MPNKIKLASENNTNFITSRNINLSRVKIYSCSMNCNVIFFPHANPFFKLHNGVIMLQFKRIY